MNTARHVTSTAGLPFVDQDEALLRQEAVERAMERAERAARRMDAASLAYGMAVHDSRTTRFERAQKASVRQELTEAHRKAMRDALHTAVAGIYREGEVPGRGA